MQQLIVGLEERSYPIWIGEELLGSLPEALRQCRFPKRVAILTNTVVAPLYLDGVRDGLRRAGFQVDELVLPDGESHKNLQTLERIFDFLIERAFDRNSGLLALGGGVVGDITGFAAATYLRGVPFVQVPTTLLAQVDSSVGGKTAVNHPRGKNLIGAFYQPRHVQIDVRCLATLPAREFSAGLAEVVKYGVIQDRDFFGWLEEHVGALLRRDAQALIHAVTQSCKIKADIVERDEKESSVRAFLNFGHTFGHAVETLTGYTTYLHGEAVAIGMVAAAHIAQLRGYATREETERLRALLVHFGLPVAPPVLPPADLLDAMARDKKVKDGRLRMVLNRGIGDCCIEDIHEPSEIVRAILSA